MIAALVGSALAALAAPVAGALAAGPLIQPAGPSGCLTQPSDPDFPDPEVPTGCTLLGTWQDSETQSLTIAPSGRRAYLWFDRRVIALARNPATGALTELPGGCADDRRQPSAPCRSLRGGLDANWQPLLPPDGRNAYVLDASGAILVLRLDAPGPRQLPGAAGCIGSTAGCRRLRGGDPRDAVIRTDPGSAVITPDGRDLLVLVAGRTVGGLAVLRRSPGSGALRPLAGSGGCLLSSPRRECGELRHVGLPSDLAVSPDGRTVLISGSAGYGVLARDPRTGDIRQLSGLAGCLGRRCRPLHGDLGAGQPLFLDDRLAVIASFFEDCEPTGGSCDYSSALLALARDPRTGAMAQLRGPGSCLMMDPVDDCDESYDVYGNFLVDRRSATITVWQSNQNGGLVLTPTRAHTGVRVLQTVLQPTPSGFADLAIRADGRAAYLSADAGAGDLLLTLTRDPRTGAMRRLRRTGCLATFKRTHCRLVRGPLQGRITPTPNGRNVYVAGVGGVAVLRSGP